MHCFGSFSRCPTSTKKSTWAHPEFHSLELHEGSDLTFQLISSSENLTPPPWTIRNWKNIYIYIHIILVSNISTNLSQMSLVQISMFFCHQGFLPSPYVSTFHPPGLVGRCLGRGRTLAPLRGGSGGVKKKPGSRWVKDNLGGGFKHFSFSSLVLGRWSNLTSIFFKWFETTSLYFVFVWKEPYESSSLKIHCYTQFLGFQCSDGQDTFRGKFKIYSFISKASRPQTDVFFSFKGQPLGFSYLLPPPQIPLVQGPQLTTTAHEKP